VRVAVDDFSRLPYVEVLANEQGDTTAGFLRRALIFLRRHNINVKRILTDNGNGRTSGRTTHRGTSCRSHSMAGPLQPPPTSP
jgi:hypothetical protein